VRALAVAIVLGVAGCETAQQGQVSLAKQNYLEGDYADALYWAESAVMRGDDPPGTLAQAYYAKAQALDRMNRRSEAAGLYEYVVRFAGETEIGFLAKARLDAIGSACTVAKPP